jgi:hypothetical protein
MTNSGIKAWDSNNNLTFNLDASTGYLELPGLKANSITGDKIASDTISTRNLLVSDLTNFVENPSFETGNLTGWTVTGGWYVNNSGPQEGTYKALTQYSASEQILINNGQVYLNALDKVKVKLFIMPDAQSTGSRITVGLSNVTGGASEDIQTPASTTTGVWTEIEVTLTATTTGSKRLRISTTGTGTGFVRIDNVRMYRMEMGNLIVDGAIKTNHMTSGTIDAGVITAGTLTSAQIKSKSILADDLVISSSDNLIVEADFGNGGASWGSGTNPLIMPTAGRASLPALRWVGSTAAVTSYNLANKIAVEDTNRYRAAFWVKSDGVLAAGRVSLNLKCYIPGGTTNIVAVQNADLVANTWTSVQGMVPVLPAGTYAIEVFLSVQNDTTFRLTDIDYVSLTRAMDGKLVVDGSITAASIAASSIGAQHLMAQSITASALNVSQLWADNSWLGSAGASSLKLATSSSAVSSIVVDGSGVSSVYWDRVSSEVNANGIRVYNTTTDANGNFVDEDPIIQLGTFSDDYFQINSGDTSTLINMDSAGTVTAKTIEAEEIKYRGSTLSRFIDSNAPRGMVAWGQVPITSSMAVAGGAEVGLFEIAWDAQDANDTTLDDQLNLARMYQFNLNDFLINTGGAGLYGLRIRMTTDGTAPTITSPIIGFKYFRTDVAGLTGTGSFTRIIGSNNGAYIRILVSLYSSGTNANVYSGTGHTHIYSTINDLGVSMPPAAVASTGGGTPYAGAPTVPPATVAKVTKTVEYGYYGSRSFLPSGAAYNYNTAKAYQGLSPAGYGNLSSQYTFNQNFQTLLSGATVNDIWVYLYFEHWYNNAGGTARIRLHNNLTTPSTNVGMTANGVDSTAWPKGSGRWVRLPTSLYAGFQSGAYKGFGLTGDGTYNTYGIANNARIRIRYTK